MFFNKFKSHSFSYYVVGEHSKASNHNVRVQNRTSNQCNTPLVIIIHVTNAV